MPAVNVLVFTDYYLPGYKGGGPIRSLANMVDQIGDEFHFKLLTRDRDLGETTPYDGIVAEQWCRAGQGEVQYLSPRALTPWAIGRLIRETGHEILYLNSFFAPGFTLVALVLRRLHLVPITPVIVAPRGELSPGAIAIKHLKKRVYVALSRFLGLYHGVVWQASTPLEEADIRRWFGNSATVLVAADMRSRPAMDSVPGIRPRKVPGRLRAVFLSRISRKKNLAGALKMLQGVQGDIEFSIYGPLEDEAYWRECQQIMRTLSERVQVHYRGVATHEQVAEIMAEHDLFFFPTFGENFGHVILEALIAGCPILISDQTPWRGLQELGVGWSLPLDKPQLFHEALQQCVDMDDVALREWSRRAAAYGQMCGRDDQVVEQNRRLFQVTQTSEATSARHPK